MATPSEPGALSGKVRRQMMLVAFMPGPEFAVRQPKDLARRQ